MPLEIKNSFDWKHPELEGMDIVERTITEETIEEFEKVLSEGNETAAHVVLAKNPILFEPLLERVGHHAMWFKNKPEIRPTLTNGKPGKIPDSLIAGKGSGGIEWFIVELKSPQDKLFNENGGFSSVANSGLAQLAQYLVYSNEKQGSIRDALEIKQFKTPQGIFVIGNEMETENNEKLQELKAFWNNSLHNILIVSYSKLLRNAKNLYAKQNNPLIS
jgi:hypothetical protein